MKPDILRSKTSTRLNNDYIKSGYFLCEDVNKYLKSENKYDFDGFYDRLDPIIYSALVKSRPETIVRDSTEYECEKEILRGANDYMWFAYSDYDLSNTRFPGCPQFSALFNTILS